MSRYVIIVSERHGGGFSTIHGPFTYAKVDDELARWTRILNKRYADAGKPPPHVQRRLLRGMSARARDEEWTP